jgi:hypothetical protein
LFITGCSSPQKKVYTRTPDNLNKQAVIICSNIDASHFVVRATKVWVKLKDDQEVVLNYYKSYLPNGYYFCSGQEKESKILE